MSQPEKKIDIYVDGCCLPIEHGRGDAGWAAVIFSSDAPLTPRMEYGELHMKGYADAEKFAILRGLQHVYDHEFREIKEGAYSYAITLHTDQLEESRRIRRLLRDKPASLQKSSSRILTLAHTMGVNIQKHSDDKLLRDGAEWMRIAHELARKGAELARVNRTGLFESEERNIIFYGEDAVRHIESEYDAMKIRDHVLAAKALLQRQTSRKAEQKSDQHSL